jgi:hypothetical protein
MWEYFVDTDTDTNDATEISSHIPEYLNGEIINIQASSNEDMILAQTDNDPTALYLYRYYWSGREKLQASWSRWVFDGDVVSMSFNRADIYILIKRGTNLFLERINLSVDDATTYTTGNFSLHLDRRVMLETGGLTTVPYTDSNTIYIDQTGKVILVGAVAAKLANSEKVFAGVPFTFKYEFSEPVMKQDNKAITTGQLHLRNYAVVFNKTGFFKVVLRPLKRTPYTRTFTGRVVGSSANLLNVAAIESGTYRFGVIGHASETSVTIESDSHLPCIFQSAEWEGFFHLRSRRM